MKRMAVQYNRLWKLLIDKKMKKSALTELTDVSSSTIAKLNRDEYVSLEVLERICRALRCDIGDVVELTEESTSFYLPVLPVDCLLYTSPSPRDA